MSEPRFIPTVAYLLGGMIVWAGAFAGAYAVTALVCARRLGDAAVLGIGVLPFSVGLITIVALIATAIIAAVAYRRWPKPGDPDLPSFVQSMALFVALMAVLGIVWNAVPALFFATCA
ncbi:MAG TPA: hypothetical protein VMO81_06570 [Aestuariivirgaceae bacterium]|nr:hypothetical protein [Aestuariivirgaceae bacterium]